MSSQVVLVTGAGTGIGNLTARALIESTIVMPGPFTSGTEHFPNAGRAGDLTVTAAYAALESLVERNEEATAGLFEENVDAEPGAVADEIARVLALPRGGRPSRTVVDFTKAGVEHANEVNEEAQRNFLTRMGFGELLRTATRPRR